MNFNELCYKLYQNPGEMTEKCDIRWLNQLQNKCTTIFVDIIQRNSEKLPARTKTRQRQRCTSETLKYPEVTIQIQISFLCAYLLYFLLCLLTWSKGIIRLVFLFVCWSAKKTVDQYVDIYHRLHFEAGTLMREYKKVQRSMKYTLSHLIIN
jgi:hypothetical protein